MRESKTGIVATWRSVWRGKNNLGGFVTVHGITRRGLISRMILAWIHRGEMGSVDDSGTSLLYSASSGEALAWQSEHFVHFLEILGWSDVNMADHQLVNGPPAKRPKIGSPSQTPSDGKLWPLRFSLIASLFVWPDFPLDKIITSARDHNLIDSISVFHGGRNRKNWQCGMLDTYCILWLCSNADICIPILVGSVIFLKFADV